MNYQVVRVDYWDYRYPTEHVFTDRKEAVRKAEELQHLSDVHVRDPLSSYIVEQV